MITPNAHTLLLGKAVYASMLVLHVLCGQGSQVDVKKSIQQDLSRHPEKVLNDHVGECVDACCPHCDNPQMEVLSGGFVRCPACGFTDRAKIELNWK